MPTLITRGAASSYGFGFGSTPAVLADPYFNYTTLLLPGNGTNGATNNTFLDSSASNNTITRNGDTTQGTFSPFSPTGWSNYFDGSGDFLSIAYNANLNPSSGTSFTGEAWVYPLTSGANFVIFGQNTGGTYVWAARVISGVLYMGMDASQEVNCGTLPINAWTHVAMCYDNSGTILRCYVNGVQAGTYSSPTITTSSTNFRIGARDSGVWELNGYISNVRIVKGTAVYTSAFTPPTTPLTAITNTTLLTCQSNRFVDNSASPFTITVNGNPSVQAFSPFQPTSAWSASTNGGSGYFDGSGDYLSASSNTAFAFGTGDFTFESWIYRSASATQEIYTTMTSGGFILYISGDKAVVREFGVADRLTSSSNVNVGEWTHVAVARSGTTLSMWLNGSRSAGGTTTSSTNFAQSGIRVGINDVGTSAFTGYLSSLRAVKGTAVYDPTQTSITVPTSPPTAITNTSLLLNFTNAGIIDNTAKNDLVTVGNAQISTAQSKFGGASMLFDGTTDYLTLQANPDLALGSGDWTVECWVYLNATANEVTVFGSKNYYVSGKNGNFVLRVGNTNVFYVFNGQTAVTNISPSSNWSTGVWTHAAWVRSSGTVTVYRNGVSIGSTANTTDLVDSANGGYIAVNFSNGSLVSGTELNGYIDDLRITKGIARYTTNFTPPTAAFPLK